MNKLKVGMYVRNKYGIAKIVNVKDNGICDVIIFDKNICFACNNETKEEISNISLSNILPITKYIDVNKINASHNIIDLIEEGDYVNGYLVLFAGATTWDNEGNIIDKRVQINYNNYDRWLSENSIKSIVTKEQFESMEYKLGDSNE